MRYDELPAKMRAQVDAQLGREGSSGKRRVSRAGTGDGQPCRYVCGCGDRFPTFTSWERHSRTSGAGHRTGRQQLDDPT